MERGRDQAEDDRNPPDDVIGARQVENVSAEPRAEKRTELVAEEYEPEQRRKVPDTEDLSDEGAGNRHGAEPQEPDEDGEDKRRRFRDRYQ